MPYAYGDYILTCGEIPYQSFGLDKSRSDLGRLSLRSKRFRLAAASQVGVALRRTTEYFLKHSRNARKSQICFISSCFSYILEKTMIHRFFFGDPVLCGNAASTVVRILYSPARTKKGE